MKVIKPCGVTARERVQKTHHFPFLNLFKKRKLCEKNSKGAEGMCLSEGINKARRKVHQDLGVCPCHGVPTITYICVYHRDHLIAFKFPLWLHDSLLD